MPRKSTATARKENRARDERLGFRVSRKTKALVERGAELEQRSLTDFCLTALTDAANEAIHRHQTLVLSERDREIFFDTLMNPPKANARLKRALRRSKELVVLR
jgi:uncharacterized protein (DUF1778 family)